MGTAHWLTSASESDLQEPEYWQDLEYCQRFGEFRMTFESKLVKIKVFKTFLSRIAFVINRVFSNLPYVCIRKTRKLVDELLHLSYRGNQRCGTS